MHPLFYGSIHLNQIIMTTILSGEDHLARKDNILNLPESMQRIMYYQGKTETFLYCSKNETETHIYWSVSEMKPRFENGKLFYTRNSKGGITCDKAKKSIKIWFGHRFLTLHHAVRLDLFKHFECEWVFEVGDSLSSVLNVSLINRIIKKRITNPRDLCKAYIKTSYFRTLDVSVEIFYQTFCKKEHGNRLRTPIAYKNYFLYATNPNEVFVMIRNDRHGEMFDSYGEFSDLVNQAAMLNRKYNPRWSKKRRHEVHLDWTKELMEIELQTLPRVEYNYKGVFPSVEGINLIDNNIDLFAEGKVMSHCVYTNYAKQVEDKTYFVLRFDYEGQRATVGINKYFYGNNTTPKFVINQMYGFRNSAVAGMAREYANLFMEREEVQEFFRNNFVSNPVKTPYGEAIAFEELGVLAMPNDEQFLQF
jgi:hypothetical protein